MGPSGTYPASACRTLCALYAQVDRSTRAVSASPSGHRPAARPHRRSDTSARAHAATAASSASPARTATRDSWQRFATGSHRAVPPAFRYCRRHCHCRSSENAQRQDRGSDPENTEAARTRYAARQRRARHRAEWRAALALSTDAATAMHATAAAAVSTASDRHPISGPLGMREQRRCRSCAIVAGLVPSPRVGDHLLQG